MMIFETLLCTLAIARSIRVAYVDKTSSRILAILVRDSMLYFGGAMLVILVNLIIWAAFRVGLFQRAIFGLS